MSSIVDLSELAKYALANYWADQLFSGKIIVGFNNTLLLKMNLDIPLIMKTFSSQLVFLLI